MVDIHQAYHPSRLAVRATYRPTSSLKIHSLSTIATEPQGLRSRAGVGAFALLSDVEDNLVEAPEFEVRMTKLAAAVCYAINGIMEKLRSRRVGICKQMS